MKEQRREDGDQKEISLPYEIPDFLGMILCLGKDRIIIQEGSWSETGRVNYYKHQGVIRNMGGPAAGHSHFLTVTCRLLTPPSGTLLKPRVLAATSLTAKWGYQVGPGIVIL